MAWAKYSMLVDSDHVDKLSVQVPKRTVRRVYVATLGVFISVMR